MIQIQKNVHPEESGAGGRGNCWGTDAEQMKELWARALLDLERHMNGPARGAWLRYLRPLRLDGDLLVIGAPNRFACVWLNERYSSLVARCVSDAAGRPLRVQFVISETAHEEAQKDEAKSRSRPAGRGHGGDFASLPLKERYTFDTFVVGASNRIAHAAAMNVAQEPGKHYNPLFIYGGTGLGKTHLLQAIAHEAGTHSPDGEAVYISGETFLNHVVTAIRDGKVDSFRNRYRNVDIWLVDDIHFIASREASRTEAEFFHTFNALYTTNRQIVIASDRPPRELQVVNERLRSRFEMGLLVDIRVPDLETRIAILQRKAEAEGMTVGEPVLRYIAGLIDSNIRSLEGALIRVIAASSMLHRPLTPELVEECLRDFSGPLQDRRITIQRVQGAVAGHFGMSLESLNSRDRSRPVAFARQVAMYLARELIHCSLPDIGAAFGGRDHTTVLYACEKIRHLTDDDSKSAALCAELTDKIRHF